VSHHCRESSKNYHQQPVKEKTIQTEEPSQTKPNKRTGREKQSYKRTNRERSNQTEGSIERSAMQSIRRINKGISAINQRNRKGGEV